MAEANNPVVLVERRGHVTLVTLNRPEARNACNQELWVAAGQAIAEAGRDPEVRAVVVTGAGDLSFCAGMDLKAAARGEAIVPADPAQAAWGFAGITTHHIAKPIIAAVNGTALGGGTELALACDLVVAVEEATFGLPEVKRGLVAGAGGMFRLGAQIPRKVAMEMLLTGNPITARRALELGLVNQVVPRAQLIPAALALAAAIAANAPLAVQAAKRVALGIDGGTIPGEQDNWQRSRRESAALRETDDAKEGPRAFAEKREPQWKAR